MSVSNVGTSVSNLFRSSFPDSDQSNDVLSEGRVSEELLASKQFIGKALSYKS